MTQYTVHLFRSGRVWVQEGATRISKDVDPPLLTETVEIPDDKAGSAAFTAVPVLGKLLLKYVDKANQPHQHVCAPCELPHVPAPAPAPRVYNHTHPACTACRYPNEDIPHPHPPCEACR
jgi:hypothetical protein